MNQQLWVASNTWMARNPDRFVLDASALREVVPSHMPDKPFGGLWTSTYDFLSGSAYIQWALEEEHDISRADPIWQSCWLLEPDSDARIYTVDTYGDLQALARLCRPKFRRRGLLDWSRIAKEFDAVHATDAGLRDTQFSKPPNLGHWDHEGTLWFRWKFSSVKPIGEQAFPCLLYDDIDLGAASPSPSA